MQIFGISAPHIRPLRLINEQTGVKRAPERPGRAFFYSSVGSVVYCSQARSHPFHTPRQQAQTACMATISAFSIFVYVGRAGWQSYKRGDEGAFTLLVSARSL